MSLGFGKTKEKKQASRWLDLLGQTLHFGCTRGLIGPYYYTRHVTHPPCNNHGGWPYETSWAMEVTKNDLNLLNVVDYMVDSTSCWHLALFQATTTCQKVIQSGMRKGNLERKKKKRHTHTQTHTWKLRNILFYCNNKRTQQQQQQLWW